jgi:hypothetical protein
MNALFAVLLGLGFMGFIIWRGLVQARQTHDNLRRLAEKLGLQVEATESSLGVFLTSPRAQGLVDGRALELYTFSKGSGKSRSTWCALRIRPALARAVEFDLSPQGLGSRVMGWFGVKEITVGQREFDAAFFVRTNEPALLTAALVPDIQAKLLAAQQAGVRGTFKLEKGELTYSEQGTFAADKLCAHFETAAAVLRDLADVAEVVGRA